MGERITNQAEYDKYFPTCKREKALATALDIRKFEIDLYWRRTTYFWGLLGVAFAGYFALKREYPVPVAQVFLITCIGLVLSLSWYLVNRGSKYWQENWEKHLDELEDEFEGPLYKTILSEDMFCLFNPFSGYPLSVSRINQAISLYVTAIWAGLFLRSLHQRWFLSLDSPSSCSRWVSAFDWPGLLLSVITVVCALYLTFGCTTKRPGNKRRTWSWRATPRVTFDRRERGLSVLPASAMPPDNGTKP